MVFFICHCLVLNGPETTVDMEAFGDDICEGNQDEMRSQGGLFLLGGIGDSIRRETGANTLGLLTSWFIVIVMKYVRCTIHR